MHIKANFNLEKSAKLADLRASIKYPAKVDNSETESEILKLETQKEENRQLFLNFTKLLAVYNNAKKEIARLQGEKNALLTKLVDFEQNYIIEKTKGVRALSNNRKSNKFRVVAIWRKIQTLPKTDFNR